MDQPRFLSGKLLLAMPGGTDPVGSAIGKMVRVLPAPLAGSVSALRQVPTGALRGATRVPDPVVTATLVHAADEHRRVRIMYRMAEDGTRDRPLEIDPWAVTVWRSRWYLLGWSHGSGARRVYRVDRVLDATALGTAFTPPEGLDLRGAVDRFLPSGPTGVARVRLRSGSGGWLRRAARSCELGEGYDVLEVDYADLSTLAADLAGLPCSPRPRRQPPR